MTTVRSDWRVATLPPDYLRQFSRRMVQDAVAEATAAYWRRRTGAFERARPAAVDV
ncbi:hypothetical protein [Nocardioides sp. zg-1228]|uniref:hypothetical protein n=1 Tax=Nocardioides sp. zg-1228 TaxID=2763008 RepID=UPI001642F2ED|nr:hypothetical protein [Nocardioides sp. zg-1228]MBC2934698.1 hypothetical protein [Nocardioides sp. zg-1228]QSF56016.1 hypothetical protein JX575_09945 [Nocardioides sp. zg-1228]